MNHKCFTRQFSSSIVRYGAHDGTVFLKPFFCVAIYSGRGCKEELLNLIDSHYLQNAQSGLQCIFNIYYCTLFSFIYISIRCQMKHHVKGVIIKHCPQFDGIIHIKLVESELWAFFQTFQVLQTTIGKVINSYYLIPVLN